MSNSLIGTRSVFTKTVSVLTSVATLLTLSGAAYLAPLAANAAVPSDYGLTEGNMISAVGSNDPDVYIVNDWGYKRLFLNPAIFNMYGQLTGGWSLVKPVSAAARDAFPTTQLFRNCETNAQAVYAVAVTGEDTATLHHVVMSGDAAVAQDANFFKKVFCVNSREQAWYGATGSDYTSLSQIPPYVRGGVGATPTPSQNYGPLSVSLASDNPASGTLVKSQAAADLLHLQFNGTGTVTNVQLKRIGVSADTDLVNVYLYQGAKRLTDAATVSNGVISFNDTSSTGLFQVNGSAVISVRADLSSNSGETVGVQLTSWNGNTTSISGNLFTPANATLTTMVLSAAGSTTPGNLNLDPASDVVVFQNTTTVGSQAVWLNSVQFRVIGSVAVGDVRNFRLFIDGIQKGTAVAQTDANGYIVFDMTGAPVSLQSGSHIVKVLADVVSGSGKNFYLSIRQASDFFTVDSQYNQPVVTTLVSGNFALSAGVQSIQSGSLTVVKTQDSPSGDIVRGATGVVLARYTFTASGESQKVESLNVSNTSAPNLALRNGALFADGIQIGSTQTIWNDANTASHSTAYTQYTLGSSLIVVPGTPRIVEIRADIYDASGTDNTATGNTIVANIEAGSSNVQRLTTLDYLATPYGKQAGNVLTIKTGSLSAGKLSSYANQSVVAPTGNFKLAAYTLTSASSEDVNINTLTFDAVPAIPASLSGDFSNAYVVVKNDTGSVVLTTATKSTFSTSASNSYSVNFLLPKNKTYQIELWGTANASFDVTGTADVFTSNFDASGVTVGSSTPVTATQVTGQVITSAGGTLTITNGASPAASFVNGGSTKTGYAFSLTPVYDNYTLDEVYVDLTQFAPIASTTGAVALLSLKNATTGATLATATVNSVTGSASFTGLNLPMLGSDGTKNFTVDVQFANVGAGANDTAGKVTVQLDGLKYRNGAGTSTTQNGYVPASFTGNANYDVKGYPTFANTALPTSALNNGTVTLFKTVVSATGGQVGWNDITFTVASTSGTMTLATSSYQLWENGSNITGLSVGATASDSYTGSNDNIEFSFATERVISSGTTLELRATVGGVTTAGWSISTQIANPKTTVVTTDDAVVQAASGASFVWSDQSAAVHNLTTSDDWFTDGLVQGLAATETVTH